MEPSSLAQVVDTVNEASFLGRTLPTADRRRLARWIAGRPGGYSGLPAPSDEDRGDGILLFTGERVRTGAGTAHVLGEEACRALIVLGVRDRVVRDALDRAQEGMLPRLAEARQREANMGRKWRGGYCCGTCSCALWRHLAAGGFDAVGPEEWLEEGMKSLREHRTGNGRWRRYPFWYTLLLLSELDSPGAIREARHAAPACERILEKRSAKAGTFERRRRVLAERILEKT